MIFTDDKPEKFMYRTSFLTPVFGFLRMMPQQPVSIPLLFCTPKSQCYVYYRKRICHNFCIISRLLPPSVALKTVSPWQGKMHGSFTRLFLPAQEQRREIQMSGMCQTWQVAWQMIWWPQMQWKWGSGTHSCVRASWERSWTATRSVVWVVGRRQRSLTGEAV